MNSIWLGYDPREFAAYSIACSSLRRHLTRPIEINGLILSDLQERGLYRRPIEWRKSVVDRPIMWDTLSDAPMSTEHANARFLVPHLAQHGWALFMDGDILVRADLGPLFDSLDPKYAAYCVKHDHVPTTSTKMDGQRQTLYARKNWSSFLFFNCDHEANKALTLDVINTLPGRDLHRLFWLEDELIGELGHEWNFLVGYTSPHIDPKVVHFTNGLPDMPGYENVPYADEWRAERDRLAARAA